jgi:hypothetical protein
MLELLTTDGFAAWFSGLAASPAEDVAATLEVIVQLGTGAEAPGSSEWLLWYEHPSVSQRPLPDLSERLAPEIVRFSHDWGHFNGYVRRIVKHLESTQFVTRLTRLSPADAAAVTEAVRRIRRLATTAVGYHLCAPALPQTASRDEACRVRPFARRRLGDVPAWRSHPLGRNGVASDGVRAFVGVSRVH